MFVGVGAWVLVAVSPGLSVFVGAGVEVGVPGPVVVVGASVSVGESVGESLWVAVAVFRQRRFHSRREDTDRIGDARTGGEDHQCADERKDQDFASWSAATRAVVAPLVHGGQRGGLPGGA